MRMMTARGFPAGCHERVAILSPPTPSNDDSFMVLLLPFIDGPPPFCSLGRTGRDWRFVSAISRDIHSPSRAPVTPPPPSRTCSPDLGPEPPDRAEAPGHAVPRSRRPSVP